MAATIARNRARTKANVDAAGHPHPLTRPERVPTLFTQAQLEAITDALGDTTDGLTG
jgi:hypothetical protein